MKSSKNDLLLYFNTIKFLRWKQIIYRLLRHRKTKIKENNNYLIREYSGGWISPAKRNKDILNNKNFIFLNHQREIQNSTDWNNSEWPKLWLYNLHYFNDLNALDANKRLEIHKHLIDRWVKENPPGCGIGWEPYPISLRVVNWIKWALSDNSMKNDWHQSLILQGRYLYSNIEYHLLGNHLFANAKALLFLGLYFKGSEADSFYKKGLEIYNDEITEQVLKDGGNFELSTMYHSIFLEDLLDIVNIHNAFGKALPEKIINVIENMIFWLKVMCHPDGEISFFNDAAFNIAPCPRELQEYISRLSLDKEIQIDDGITTLNESGYSRIQKPNMVAIIDTAAIGPDYQPSHAHADTLSFELSLFGYRVIVNSGTSTYEEIYQRLFERGTSSHSTLTIDNKNSSEVWKSFRVARRARVIEKKQTTEDERIILSASHDGYKRLRGKPIHNRQWFAGSDFLEIQDSITGKYKHEIEVILPLHPDVVLKEVSANLAYLNIKNKRIKISFKGNGELLARDSKYHPEFGNSIDNIHLAYIVSDELPLFLATRIEW